MLKVWHPVASILPRNGEWIEGRNEAGRTWIEEWDSDEPVGAMVEWRYLNVDDTHLAQAKELIDLSETDDIWREYDRT